jgi:hypothetical protein
MASSKWRGPPPHDGESDPQKMQCLATCISENSTSVENLKALPSRATLARRFRLPQVAAAAERDRLARYWLGLPQRMGASQ